MARILIVDDSRMDRHLAGRLLGAEDDLELVEAEDGEAALARLRSESADLVLTDLSMPRMDGLELVSAIKEELPLTPVILMTAQGSEELAAEALQAGAAGYVAKRRLAKDLPATVRRVLHASREHVRRSAVLQSMDRSTQRFTLKNESELIPGMVQHFQQLVGAAWGVDGTERVRLAVALEEALVNAMHHGNLELDSKLRGEDHQAYLVELERRRSAPPYCDRRIRVTMELTTAELRVVIEDEGSGFDPGSLPDPTDPDFLDRPHGRGVMLMRSFMDEVNYEAGGTRVELVRRREPSQAEEQAA
jgi:CheY-like chemotaxis protein